MFAIFRQNLFKFFLNHKHLKVLTSIINKRHPIPQNGFFFLSYLSCFQYYLYGNAKNEIETYKVERYFAELNVERLLEMADNLYEDGAYLEVYEILNRMQYHNIVEVQWRVCRSLFKLSMYEHLSNGTKTNIILEAHTLILRTLQLDRNHAQVHKWMAIITDAKAALEGTISRVRVAPEVKEHMLKCAELNPKDVSVLYMLGIWCYEMTSLTWVQRNLAKIFFNDPPESSFEEAYSYFMKVEQLYPRSLFNNIYMLGKCCYNMGMFYKARYYLQMAAALPVTTEHQKIQVEEAKTLAEELKEYDVAMLALGSVKNEADVIPIQNGRRIA